METEKSVVELPNPEVPRENCVMACLGCEKQYGYEKGVSDGVCIAYESPKLKWRGHSSQKVVRHIKGKEVEMRLHFNPCPLASHAKHTLSQEEARKLNPLKASKRGRR